jgi:ribosomal-protein-alanine N-acetyltransferase
VRDTIITDRLTLTKYSQEDIEEIINLIKENPERLSLYFTVNNNSSSEEIEKVAQDFNLETLNKMKKEQEFTYTIRNEDNNIIGTIGVGGFRSKNASFFYWLGKNYEGKGYASEALKTIEKEIYESENCQKATIGCAHSNTLSKNLATKNNYKSIPTPNGYRKDFIWFSKELGDKKYLQNSNFKEQFLSILSLIKNFRKR